MSRVGKQPVNIKGLTLKPDGDVISFSNGKQTELLDTKGNVKFKIENDQLVFSSNGEDRQSKAYWGTYRSLAQNIVIGLTQGYKIELEINGVGYRAAVSGKNLELQLGYSHPISHPIPDGIKITVNKNIIVVEGHNKQQVGQQAAIIRSYRAPEPYKGKGVKYVTETIRRKAGKTAGK
jgi:large subunit ribosomal protein L6